MDGLKKAGNHRIYLKMMKALTDDSTYRKSTHVLEREAR